MEKVDNGLSVTVKKGFSEIWSYPSLSEYSGLLSYNGHPYHRPFAVFGIGVNHSP
jgi:hypothetical protein